MTDFEHDDLLKRLESLTLDVPPLPEDFHAGWAGRLEDEMENKRKPPKKTALIRALSAAAALVFVVSGSLLALRTDEPFAVQSEAGYAKNASRSADTGAADMARYEMATEEYDLDGVAGGASAAMPQLPAGQMLIRTASMTIGTQQYDESLSVLSGLCESSGGWISSTSENTMNSGLRTCYMTLRIPAEQLDAFLAGTGGLGRVTYRSESVEDVTESYYDTKGRLETQKALMARLQALVTDAASLSELLELEAQIADTQYQLDRLQSSLNSTERRVNYATVDITLREESAAADITDGDKSLGERLVSAVRSGIAAFGELLENAVVFLAAALPFIAIVAVVWLAVAILRRMLRKGK